MHIGTDIIEVSRIEKLIIEKGDKFLKRIYTDKEIDYCESKGPNKYQHYAGRFAAKEAIMKAYGTNKFNFKTIEIINNEDGLPKVELLSNLDVDRFIKISVSISHIKDFATANAIVF